MAVFGKSNGAPKKVQENILSSFNSITNGTTIKGDVETNGDIRIDGKLTGTLRSAAKLVLGEGAVIEGDLYCQNADISGTVLGNIFVDDLLTLKGTAKVNGDLKTGKLVIEVGAEFNGECKMGNHEGTGRRERKESDGPRVLTEV